ncbi:serpin B4-like [Lycorma delicatula]|uniref:serpin B4-like n=1 Tax=Lycorma delicatula TaxID=130591 RepID=UPI003F51363E
MGIQHLRLCITCAIGLVAFLQVESEAATILPPTFPHGSNFVGEGTNELATALLQGFVNEEKNFVFSPLGYSVILGVLAEGARGNTRNQLVSALHLPEDTYAVRQTYKKVLGNLRSCLICEDNTDNIPQFKNWFYVYKNFTIDESYKKILEENYLTDVLSVERPDAETEMKIEVQFTDDSNSNKSVSENNSPSNVNDKNSVVKYEQKPLETSTSVSTVPVEQKPENEKEILEQKDISDDQTTTSSVYNFDNESVAALSVNKLASKTDETGKNIVSKMITFNGLYYRGKWSTPFEITKSAEEKNFYISNEKKKPVTMLRTEGMFEIGDLPELESTAIELPYLGERYSFLILLPNSRDGLVKLTADLAGYSLSRFYMKKQLTSKLAEVYLPKFMFQTISKPENILREYGIQDIFSENADLTGISSDSGLFLDELVQLVTVEVDERSSETNFLAVGTVTETRSNFEKVKVDHPFLFFIRDKIDNVIIAAGKVHDPSLRN